MRGFVPPLLPIAVTAVVALVACSSGDSPSPAADPLAVTSVSFSNGELSRAFEESTAEYEFTSLSNLLASTVTVSGRGIASVSVNGIEQSPASPIAVNSKGIGAGDVITVEVRGARGERRAYRFSLRPADFPVLTVTYQQPADGHVLISAFSATDPSRGSYAIVLDKVGQPVAYRRATRSIADFQYSANRSGEPRFLYCEFDRIQLVQRESSGDCYSMDLRMRRLGRLSALPSPGNPAGVTDHHEVVMIDDDHYLVAAYTKVVVSNIPPDLTGGRQITRTVYPSLVQEIRRGQVIFEWDGAKDPTFYRSSRLDNDFANPASLPDYMHLNSIQVDPKDGNLLISLRHNNQVVKINRTTGSVIWRLGGTDSTFPLTSAQQFSAQHHARRLHDGRIMLYDNGNLNPVSESRALIFDLDEDANSVRGFTEFKQAGYFGSAMGSAHLVGTRYLVGWGFVSFGQPSVTETDPVTGIEHFKLTFAERGMYSYRALKVTLQ